MPDARPYGVLAEFRDPRALVSAAAAARAAGYRELDAFTPMPVEGLDEALGSRPRRLALLVLLAGILGGAGGFFMQYYANVVHYRLIIGGKPFDSWPAFIPITFELTILSAAVTAVVGMLALNGLPQPYHPLFSVPRFELASRQAFFLCVESTDAKFDAAGTRAFLASLGPVSVSEVPGW